MQEQLQHHARKHAISSTASSETGTISSKHGASTPAAGSTACSTAAACRQDLSQQMQVAQQPGQQQPTTFQRRLPTMNMPQPPQQQHKSPADPHNLLHRPNPQAHQSQVSGTQHQPGQQQQQPYASASASAMPSTNQGRGSGEPEDSRSAALSGRLEVRSCMCCPAGLAAHTSQCVGCCCTPGMLSTELPSGQAYPSLCALADASAVNTSPHASTAAVTKGLPHKLHKSAVAPA